MKKDIVKQLSAEYKKGENYINLLKKTCKDFHISDIYSEIERFLIYKN